MSEKKDTKGYWIDAEEQQGIIFDVERFSLHDGTGCRTVVYLKGCPLHCVWCANPESQLMEPQIGFYREKCAFCKNCVAVCPQGERFFKEGAVPWDACRGCQKCTEVCAYEARVAYGKIVRAKEVVEQVLRDRIFYKHSDGGVTLSGGEVCLQPEFSKAILYLCQKEGIHTAIETTGFCAQEQFKSILPYVDQLLYDFKCMDSKTHKKYTGVGNEKILENAIFASKVVREMIVRFPVIPGVNDTEENVNAMADFLLKKMPRVKCVDLLPYHSVGKSKCEKIGKVYNYEPPYELTEERIKELSAILCERGLEARIGG